MTQEQLYDIYRSDGIVHDRYQVHYWGPLATIRSKSVPLYRGAPKGLRRALRNKYHWLHAA